MKGFKLSKPGLLILAAGAFVVVLAGLGITRYSQISEQTELNDKLSLSVVRLDNIDIKPFQLQLVDLQEQFKDSEIQFEEAKNRLVQTVISVNVTDKFYQIAAYNSVIVNNISTTKNQTEVYESVKFSLITINAAVTGSLSHVIDFIAGLNDNFETGFVRSAQITITDAATEDGTTANVMMIVYSYEGS